VTAHDRAARAALELLTPPELAALLGVKVQTLAAWRVSGSEVPTSHSASTVTTPTRCSAFRARRLSPISWSCIYGLCD
jgi:hypothetical protein